MTTPRQRIRKVGISPYPWLHYRGEIQRLPISAQTLFKNKGLPWDILEIELKGEGWILQDENLWDVLETDVMRKLNPNDLNPEPWDDTWTEEDFIHFYEGNKNENYC